MVLIYIFFLKYISNCEIYNTLQSSILGTYDLNHNILKMVKWFDKNNSEALFHGRIIRYVQCNDGL
jgi:hypothetical protein